MPQLDTFGNPIDPAKTYRVIETDAVGNAHLHPYSCTCEVCRSVNKPDPDAPLGRAKPAEKP